MFPPPRTNTLSPHSYDHVPLPEQRDASEVPQKPPQGQVTPAPAAAKQRDAFFDNAKYLAIVLVAMGHSWEPVKDGSRTVEGIYLFVYAFTCRPSSSSPATSPGTSTSGRTASSG
jgi:hypothetical protein